MDKDQNYIPALRFKWLTGIYDWVVGKTMPEQKFKTELISQAKINKGYEVLDFGSGTATLSLIAKGEHPDSKVTGVDVDEQIISIARKKIRQANTDIEIIKYDGVILPFQDNTFDRVISSLVFHHLTPEQKQTALKEIYRILKPGGELHIADWGKAKNLLMRILFLLVQILDGFKTTSDNVKGLMPHYIGSSGFKEVKVTKIYNTIFGTLELFKAKK